MAGVAQLVRAPDCDSGGRGFEPRHSPHLQISSLGIIRVHTFLCALVAQLDRALPSEGKGRWFESNQVHHIEIGYILENIGNCFTSNCS